MQANPPKAPAVSYVLTLADYEALHKVMAKRTENISYAVWSVVLVPYLDNAVSLIGGVWRYFTASGNWPILPWYFFIWLAWSCLPLGYGVHRVRSMAHLKASPQFGNQETVWLENDGLHCHTTQSISLNQWAALHSLVETKSHFFLVLDKRHAVIIPKRAFESLEEQKNFLDFARNSWHQAHPSKNVDPIAMP